MNEKNPMQPLNEQSSFQDMIIEDVHQKISKAATDAENVSKEKYATKTKMIEAAIDMSTKEKLDALDKNYDRRNQEHWQNVLYFAIISFSVAGIAIGSPMVVKNVRKLFTIA